MDKIYTALGLMTGTSVDGVDLSIIQSNGQEYYKSITDEYFEFDKTIYNNILNVRDKINDKKDLYLFKNEINQLEREITLFHAKVINKVLNKKTIKVDMVGFHGQTIYHNSLEKITKQLGDGMLLSQLIKKKVIFDFRQNDINSGGQGAPLTPIFHRILVNNIKLSLPIYLLNIGGISNLTIIKGDNNFDILSKDIGPGNFMIDDWVRKNKKGNYDKDGNLAKKGFIKHHLQEQFLENVFNSSYIDKNQSYDIKDFDISCFRGLSVEDGAATLTDLTAKIISDQINNIKLKNYEKHKINLLICGGGRKNKFLLQRIKKYIKTINIIPIDKHGVNGDYIESQAFAYLSIRSFLKLPLSYPNTTGCKKPLTGGILANNY